jgi:hypothetical protein
MVMPLPTHAADAPSIAFGACTKSQTPTVLSTPSFQLAGVTTNVGIAPVPSTTQPAMLVVTAGSSTTTMPAATYGFLNYLNGVTPVYQSGYRNYLDQGIFTFYSTSALTQTTLAGSIISTVRTGTFGINLSDTSSGHFYNPSSFQGGTPLLTGTINEQIMPNADGQTFTSISTVTITSVTPFSFNGTCYQIGSVGQSLNLTGSGQLAGPQSATVSFTAATR